MTNLIRYFADRPLLCNIVMFGTIVLSIFVWQRLGKEEMPEFAREAVRVSLRYPGASAADVEQLVTKPVEERIRTVNGIKEINSTASIGSTSIRVEFETGIKDLVGKIQEVKDAVSRAKLPDEIDDPEIRQFNTAEKAIIDIAIFHKTARLLDTNSREKNAEKIAKGEENRFRKGRIDLERLISAQDLVASAELSDLKQQIALRKTVIQWLAATDQLTDKSDVVAPWNLLE
jgi:hydrophobic/amphiphilic exporter-1 (mainly G- bacteria), HAE1 family